MTTRSDRDGAGTRDCAEPPRLRDRRRSRAGARRRPRRLHRGPDVRQLPANVAARAVAFARGLALGGVVATGEALPRPRLRPDEHRHRAHGDPSERAKAERRPVPVPPRDRLRPADDDGLDRALPGARDRRAGRVLPSGRDGSAPRSARLPRRRRHRRARHARRQRVPPDAGSRRRGDRRRRGHGAPRRIEPDRRQHCPRRCTAPSSRQPRRARCRAPPSPRRTPAS